jgi:hypothetical protein
MATESNPDPAFSKFLEAQPTTDSLNSVALLSGRVFRAESAGRFLILTAHGPVELTADAVRRHKVLDTSGIHPVVQLEVDLTRIKRITKDLVKEAPKDGIKDPVKEVAKDPLKDGIKDPIHDPKFAPKDPVFDPERGKVLAWDPPKGWDPGVDPSGALGTPLANQGAEMLRPFVLATPHHAPQGAVAQQAMGWPGGGGLKPIQLDTFKEVARDTWKEVVKDPIHDIHTRKEFIKDPIKEIAEPTWVERTDPTGGLVDPPIHNFPGHMW